jgi:hypothetical protein
VRGRSDRLELVVHHIARWLRDEEAAGSNPATPTQVTGHSPTMGRGLSFCRTAANYSTVYEPSCLPIDGGQLSAAAISDAWPLSRPRRPGSGEERSGRATAAS